MNILRKLTDTEVYRNFFLTLGGSAGAQLLPILITPILAQLYAPEIFGVFGVFMAYTYLLSKTLSFSYFQTIMLPRNDIKAMALLILSLGISFGSSIILVIILSVLWALNIVASSDIQTHSFELGMACFFFMGNVTLEMWLARKKRYGFLSISRILRATLVAILSIAFFYGFTGADALIYSFVIGNALPFLYTAFVIYSKNKRIARFQSATLIFLQAKRYFNYAFFSTPAYLINNLTNYLPVFFIARYYDPKVIGYYYLAERVIRSPLGLVSDSFANVLFQHLTVVPKKQIKSETHKYARILGGIGVAAIVLFLLCGKFLFETFFSSEWSAGFQLIQVVVVYGIIQMVFTIYSLPLKVAELNKQAMYWEILRFLLILVPLTLIPRGSIVNYLVGYGISLTLSYFVLAFYNHYVLTKMYGR